MKRSQILSAVLIAACLLPASRAADDTPPAPFVHIVLFTLVTKDVAADEAEKLIVDCHEMLEKIPTVKSLRVGRPSKKEAPAMVKKNYDVALVITFADAAGMEEYAKHPDHLKFVEKHGKFFNAEKMQVFDFMNEKK